MLKYFIGVDLGGTKILSAIITPNGKIVGKVYLPTEANKGKNAVIKNIVNSIHCLCKKTGISLSKISAIGIGAPGPVDFKKGLILNPPNLKGWKKVFLRKILQDKLGKKIFMDNDANAAALGEFIFGAAKGKENSVYVTISTGIGGGIIINGKPYRGNIGGAGEIGHMIIKENGPKCGCGKNGCLESLASGSAIQKTFNKTAEEVALLAKKGDLKAKNAIQKASYFLGIGLGNIINILSPDIIILGGGITQIGPIFLNPAIKTAKKQSLAPANKKVKIVKAKLGQNAGVLGAAALCIVK